MLAQSRRQLMKKIVDRLHAHLEMKRYRDEFVHYSTWREYRRFLENKGEARPRFFESPATSRFLMERAMRKLKGPDPELENAWTKIKADFEQRQKKKFGAYRDPWRPKPPFKEH